jgi:hypothetical protein
MGASPRPIRFVMDHRIFNTPLLRLHLPPLRRDPHRLGQGRPGTMMEAAFAEVAAALANGALVAFFRKAAITRDGELQPFRPGITRILKRQPGAGCAAGAFRPMGQLFFADRRRGDETPFRRGAPALANAVGSVAFVKWPAKLDGTLGLCFGYGADALGRLCDQRLR